MEPRPLRRTAGNIEADIVAGQDAHRALARK